MYFNSFFVFENVEHIENLNDFLFVQAPVERKIDLNEFSEVEEIAEDEISNALGVYFNDGEESNRIPVYNNYVGLMVEELKEDTTMQQLWELIPSTSTQN